MARHALLAFKVARQINHLSRPQPGPRHVLRIEKDDAPPAPNSAITIIEPVDRRVELIVAADRHHQILIGREIMARDVMHCEMSASRRRSEIPFARGVRQVEAARLAHAPVIVIEARNDARDVVADAISSPRVARARRAMIAGSLKRKGEAGRSEPREACTMPIEFSMLTNCGPAA